MACGVPPLTDRIDEVVDFVEIGDAIDRRVGTYSGGMKRRVDLASALIHEPRVLFLDEPNHRPRPGEPGQGVGGGSPPQPPSWG